MVIGTRREEFDWLLSREIPHLRRYAYALVHDPVSADDLVQDCLERALRKRHLWQPRGRVRGWLFRILYRTYLNDRSSARTRREVVTPDAGEPLIAADSQEAHAQCHEVLAVVDAGGAARRVAADGVRGSQLSGGGPDSRYQRGDAALAPVAGTRGGSP